MCRSFRLYLSVSWKFDSQHSNISRVNVQTQVMTALLPRTRHSSSIMRLPFDAMHVDTCLRWLDAVFDVMTNNKPNENCINSEAELQYMARISGSRRECSIPSSGMHTISPVQLQPTKDHEELVSSLSSHIVTHRLVDSLSP